VRGPWSPPRVVLHRQPDAVGRVELLSLGHLREDIWGNEPLAGCPFSSRILSIVSPAASARSTARFTAAVIFTSGPPLGRARVEHMPTLVEPPRTPDPAPQCEGPLELDSNERPHVRAPTMVQDQAKLAIDDKVLGVSIDEIVG
jgi:hypothetical protein